jgi:predicted  nucleic acid-binding Zn-ribbon protein
MGLRDEVAVLEVKDQLLRLVRLQEIAMEVRSARALMDGAPSRVEEIEAQFRERNAEYVAVKQRFDALDEDQKTRSTELVTLEEHKTKYMADLMQVQNQREYAAMLKEIDAVKAQIAEHEEAILSDMEEIETVKVELATHEEHIKTERERVDKERSDVEAAADAARQSIATLEDERSSLENELPLSLVGSVRRLEESRQGQFLSKAEEGVCHSCFVRVRPQGFQEVKLAIKIHYCSNCRRLLYHEPTLKRMAAEAKGGEPGSNPDTTIEAADGGAV